MGAGMLNWFEKPYFEIEEPVREAPQVRF